MATRHLVRSEKGFWTGWNSDRVLRTRQGIIDSLSDHKYLAERAEKRVEKISAKIDELDADPETAGSKLTLFRAVLETAKVAVERTANDLSLVATIAAKMDDTHPAIVDFAIRPQDVVR